MLQYLDFDRTLLILSAGCISPVTTAAVPRGAGEMIRVQIVNSQGKSLALAPGFEMIWIGKAKGDYSGTPLVYADTFTFDADNQWYETAANYGSDTLNAMLGGADSVFIDAQFAYRLSPSDEWQRSQVINLEIHNSVWRTLDTPIDLAPVPWVWLKSRLIADNEHIGLEIDEEAQTITIKGIGYQITQLPEDDPDYDPAYLIISQNGTPFRRFLVSDLA